MNSIQKISNYLKENNMELYEKFRQIIAMARSRQDARQEINAQSIPLFKHLVPYIIMKNNKMVPPVGWSDEIKAFLLAIDSKNRRKNKFWFSAKEIQSILNGLLDSIVIKKIIFNKLKPFTIPKIIINEIDLFFNQNPTLEKLGTELKYIPSEGDKELSLFFKGIKI